MLQTKYELNNIFKYFKKDGLIAVYTILLIFITPIDYILYIKWIDSMKNYNWFASSLIFPLFGIFFFYIGTMYYYLKNQLNDSNIIQKKKLGLIGLLDCLSSQLSSFATPYLSIIVITILDKLSLPLLLLFSFIFLKTQYFKNHYLGVFLTLYAISISFLPKFSDGSDNQWWAVILFSISILPSVISFILKENYLNNQINIWWMNLYISIFQFLFGIFLLPFMFIPIGKEGVNYIDVHHLNNYFTDASKCQFLGINSKESDDCTNSFIWMIFYQIISTFINILMFYMIKEASSTYFVLINSLKIPIQAWLASYKFISGSNYEPVKLNDIFCFILLVVATLIYQDKKEEKKTTKKPLLDLNNDLDDYLINGNNRDEESHILTL